MAWNSVPRSIALLDSSLWLFCNLAVFCKDKILKHLKGKWLFTSKMYFWQCIQAMYFSFTSASLLLCIHGLIFFRTAAACIAPVLPKVSVKHCCVAQKFPESLFGSAILYFNLELEHLFIFPLVHHCITVKYVIWECVGPSRLSDSFLFPPSQFSSLMCFNPCT